MEQPIQLFSNADINIKDKCCICLEDLIEDKYKIPECYHEFHTKCIFSWLRSGNTSCPICRNNDGYIYFSFERDSKSFLMDNFFEYSKKNKLNSSISKLLNNYKKIKKKNKLHLKEIIKIRKKNINIKKDIEKKFKEIYKNYIKEKNNLKKEKLNIFKEEDIIKKKIRINNTKIRKIEDEISKIPLCPIKLN